MQSPEIRNERRMVLNALHATNSDRFEACLRRYKYEPNRAFIAAVIFRSIALTLQKFGLYDKYIRESIRLNEVEISQEHDLWIALSGWTASFTEKLVNHDPDHQYHFDRKKPLVDSVRSLQSCVEHSIRQTSDTQTLQFILSASYHYLKLKRYIDKEIYDQILMSK